jgi:hypothetical protein
MRFPLRGEGVYSVVPVNCTLFLPVLQGEQREIRLDTPIFPVFCHLEGSSIKIQKLGLAKSGWLRYDRGQVSSQRFRVLNQT